MTKRQRDRNIAMAAIVGIIVLIVALRYIPLVKSRQSETKLSSYLDQCVEHGRSLSMHTHPHLTITIDGQRQVIPANVGVEPFCLRPVHTHDDSGTIHLEFPQPRAVMVGDFFTVWGKRFDRNCVLGSCTGAGKTVRMTVNGKDNTEFERYVMKDKDQIEIIVE